MTKHETESFATKLRAVRIEKGLSPESLAQLAGISNKTIRNWEEGNPPKKWRAIVAVAQVLGDEPNSWLELAGLPGLSAVQEKLMLNKAANEALFLLLTQSQVKLLKENKLVQEAVLHLIGELERQFDKIRETYICGPG